MTSWPRLCPSRLTDQKFGICISPQDLILPLYTINATNYHRPWKCFPQDVGEELGSIINNEDDKLKIILDVQQFHPDEIVVKIKDNEITIEAEHEEKQDEYGFVARQFTRRYILPNDCSSDDVTATLSSDSVLIITANKRNVNDIKEEKTVHVKLCGTCPTREFEAELEQKNVSDYNKESKETDKSKYQIMLREENCCLIKPELLGEAVLKCTENTLIGSREDTDKLLDISSEAFVQSAVNSSSEFLEDAKGSSSTSAVLSSTEKTLTKSKENTSEHRTTLSEQFEQSAGNHTSERLEKIESRRDTDVQSAFDTTAQFLDEAMGLSYTTSILSSTEKSLAESTKDADALLEMSSENFEQTSVDLTSQHLDEAMSLPSTTLILSSTGKTHSESIEDKNKPFKKSSETSEQKVGNVNSESLEENIGLCSTSVSIGKALSENRNDADETLNTSSKHSEKIAGDVTSELLEAIGISCSTSVVSSADKELIRNKDEDEILKTSSEMIEQATVNVTSKYLNENNGISSEVLETQQTGFDTTSETAKRKSSEVNESFEGSSYISVSSNEKVTGKELSDIINAKLIAAAVTLENVDETLSQYDIAKDEIGDKFDHTTLTPISEIEQFQSDTKENQDFPSLYVSMESNDKTTSEEHSSDIVASVALGTLEGRSAHTSNAMAEFTEKCEQVGNQESKITSFDCMSSESIESQEATSLYASVSSNEGLTTDYVNFVSAELKEAAENN